MTRRIPTAVLWLIAAALFIVGPVIVVQGLAAALLLLWACVEYQNLPKRARREH